MLAAIPVVLIFLRFRGPYRLSLGKSILLLSMFIVWLIPSLFYEHPHWSALKVFAFGLYGLAGYSAARGYLLVSAGHTWQKYWPIIGSIFVGSCVLSAYLAFGTLLPRVDIAASDQFIHQVLYGEAFSDPEAAKGIRHTMAVAASLVFPLALWTKQSRTTFNLVSFSVASYVIFYSFSRSAWLVALCIALVIARLASRDIPRKLSRMYLLGTLGVVTVGTFALVFPDQSAWIQGIISDRISDNRSLDQRSDAVSVTLSSLGLREFLFGYDQLSHGSPHNFVLDAMRQFGIIGALAASIVALYAIKVFWAGLFSGRYMQLVAAAFVAPGMVRMFTVGDGLLHQAELFGLFVALLMPQYSEKDAPVVSAAKRAERAPTRRARGIAWQETGRKF
ncbi:hypothetical protein BH24PSE2_BH24PSE2_18940 [soil metagenome]